MKIAKFRFQQASGHYLPLLFSDYNGFWGGNAFLPKICYNQTFFHNQQHQYLLLMRKKLIFCKSKQHLIYWGELLGAGMVVGGWKIPIIDVPKS
ncbi:MAG: hypothetical protein ACNYWU_07465 [Desulfobacterales bacterium]